MRVDVTKPFPYSPHGYDNAHAAAGVQELPEAIAQIAIAEGWAQPAVDAPGAGAPGTGAGGAGPKGPTHELNATKAIEYVEGLTTVEALEAAHASESTHPEYPGGRKTVLKAIEDRWTALQEPATGAGEG